MIRMLSWAVAVLALTSMSRSADMPQRGMKKSPAKAGAITQQSFSENGRSYPYWLYVPAHLDAQKPAPLILFLHGSGEREGGAKGPHEVGMGPAIAKQGGDFPFFVVMPQFGKRGSWKGDGADAQRALKILDEVMKQYRVDEKRLYLTGLSMGGNGTWEFAFAHPKKWVAIAPVCGFYGDFRGKEMLDSAKIQSIKEVPCWCFHGGSDPVVPAKQSRDMMAALWAAGAHPNYTEFPGVGHNCWDLTYAYPQLYRWFLAHHLSD
jgi:predicted peptidase